MHAYVHTHAFASIIAFFLVPPQSIVQFVIILCTFPQLGCTFQKEKIFIFILFTVVVPVSTHPRDSIDKG